MCLSTGIWKCLFLGSESAIKKKKKQQIQMPLDRFLNFEAFFISDVSAPLFMREGFVSLVPSQPQTCSVNSNSFHIKD